MWIYSPVVQVSPITSMLQRHFFKCTVFICKIIIHCCPTLLDIWVAFRVEIPISGSGFWVRLLNVQLVGLLAFFWNNPSTVLDFPRLPSRRRNNWASVITSKYLQASYVVLFHLPKLTRLVLVEKTTFLLSFHVQVPTCSYNFLERR